MSLHLLVERERCVGSDGAWVVLLDEGFEVLVGFVSDSGSVLILMGVAAALGLRVGVVLSLWTRARRGEGGDGILARPGIVGLKIALVGKSVGYIILLCGCSLADPLYASASLWISLELIYADMDEC